MRSQLGLLLHFTDNAHKICGFAWIFEARTEIAKFRGHRWTRCGWPSGDGVYAHGSNVAGPRADGGEQESLLAEQRELGNNLGERKVESAWPGKATGRDTVNAMISMCTDFLVGTGAFRER